MRSLSWGFLVSALGLTLTFASGCQVTSQDIAHWMNTEKGPEKIRQALGDPSVPMPVRADALVALGELGMTDGLEEALRKTVRPAETRTILAEGGAVRRLIDCSRGKDPAAPPARSQRNCKDALFSIRAWLHSDESMDKAAKDLAEQIDQALVSWLATDLSVRMTAGSVGGEKILALAGPETSGPGLAPVALGTGPNQARAIELLGQYGDPTSKERVASLWIQRAQAEKPPRPETMRMLGTLGGAKAQSFLLMVAEQPGTTETRAAAIRELSSNLDARALALGLRVARDKKEPGLLREEAFALLERLKGADTVKGLLPLFGDPDVIVARRAVEAAISAGGPPALRQVLEQISPRLVPNREDLRDFLLRYVVALGSAARESLKATLQSKNALARLTALLALGEVGTRTDAQSIEKLAADPARLPVKGLQGGPTVGDQARAVVEKLRKKS